MTREKTDGMKEGEERKAERWSRCLKKTEKWLFHADSSHADL